MSENYLPTARESKFLVRELADELLVYDADVHRAHCLNRTAALVWKHCDGRTSVSGIAERVGEELSSSVSEEVVWVALEQLAEFDLLITAAAAARPTVSKLISRRKMIRRLGIAATVSLPLITSIILPTPAQAQSPCTETSCPPGTTCQAGICEPDA
jgi:hypothetical protein